MKTIGTVLVGGLALSVAGLLALREPPAPVVSVSPPPEPVAPLAEPVFFQPLEAPVLQPEPVFQPLEVPATAAPPVAVKQPVQPLEERGDAMLFEAEALLGTPFGPSVTMPFD
jgi:hypothetical protein